MYRFARRAARCVAFLCALVALFAAPIGAQNLITYDAGPFPPPLPTPTFYENAALSPLYPPAPGVTALLNRFPQPAPLAFPPGGVLPVPPGGVTIDNTNGQIWASNGPQIGTCPHNQYGATPVGGPWGVPAIANVSPPWTGLVYGMAIDPVGIPGGPGPTLWLTDSFWIVGVTPGPPFAVLFPPFASNIAFPFLGPISGLDWDPFTQSLWVIDVGGVAANLLIGGGPGPGHPALGNPLGPMAPLPATGIAIDKSGGIAQPGSPAPLQAVYAVGPGVHFEFVSGTLFPTFTLGGIELGLTFHAAPSFDPVQPCNCPALGYAVGMQLTGPMSKTNNAFSVDMTGLPPGTFALFAFDWFMAPKPFLNFNLVGCPLGFNMPPPPLFSVNAVFANAAGVASFPVNLTLPFITPGMWLFTQSAAFCPADPTGYVLSPFQQIVVSLP